MRKWLIVGMFSASVLFSYKTPPNWHKVLTQKTEWQYWLKQQNSLNRGRWKLAQSKFSSAHFKRGLQHLRKKRYSQAISQFIKAEKPPLHPLNFLIHLYKAKTLKKMGRMGSAISILNLYRNSKQVWIAQLADFYFGSWIASAKPRKAQKIFKRYHKENPQALLSLANGFRNKFGLKEALPYYFEALNYPSVDSITLRVTRILTSHYSENWPTISKIRFAEGLRIDKKYVKSLRIFLSLKLEALDYQERFWYTKNFTRLLINTGNPTEASILVSSQVKRFLHDERKELIEDFAKRMTKKNFYTQLLEFEYKSPRELCSFKKSCAQLVKAVDQLNDPMLVEVATQYLTVFDPSSFIAEKAWFRHCTNYYLNDQNMDAWESCLLQIRNITIKQSNGGKSRYFLGLHYLNHGKKNKARSILFETYANSPNSAYAFPALELIIKEFKPSLNCSEIINNEDLWLCTVVGKIDAKTKIKNRKFVEPALEWSYLINQVFNFSPTKAEEALLLLYAMDETSVATLLTRHNKSIRTNLLKTYAGMYLGKTHWYHYYFRKMIKERQLQPDIFKMDPVSLWLFLPRPFTPHVKEAAQRFDVGAAEIYALMKQESGFNPYARSWVNAQGLMQLMKPTANDIGRRIGLSNRDLYNPRTSILLGAKFFADLSSRLGSFEKATIAYNAGPGRLKEWSLVLSMEKEFFLEMLPFYETHHYVTVTRTNRNQYRAILQNPDFFASPSWLIQ